MLKWLGGIVSAVLIGTLTWWLTQGVHPESPPPPTPVPVVAPYSVTGVWRYTSNSTVSHGTYQGTMTLTQSDSNVTGVMTTPDSSSSGVAGTLMGKTMSLSRDTGLNTMQSYDLRKMSDDQFTGTFHNVGKYPDSGTIELDR